MKKYFLTFLPATLALLLALGSVSVFSACGALPDGSWMRCRRAQDAVTLSAAVLTALLVLQGLVRSKAVRIILNCAAVALCAAVFLLPGTLLPMCMLKTHSCYTALQPFARVMAVLIAGSCIPGLLSAAKAK